MKFLVSAGANIDAKDKDDWTPLHDAACCNEDVEIAKFLVAHGANVHAKNADNKTPLDIAKEKKNMVVVEYLSSVK